VTSRSHRSHSKLTVVALIALACALGGCGRKAGLDLPPGAQGASGASQEPGSEYAPAANSNSGGMTGQAAEVYRPPGSSTIAIAPRGEKKRIPIDAILD